MIIHVIKHLWGFQTGDFMKFCPQQTCSPCRSFQMFVSTCCNSTRCSFEVFEVVHLKLELLDTIFNINNINVAAQVSISCRSERGIGWIRIQMPRPVIWSLRWPSCGPCLICSLGWCLYKIEHTITDSRVLKEKNNNMIQFAYVFLLTWQKMLRTIHIIYTNILYVASSKADSVLISQNTNNY